MGEKWNKANPEKRAAIRATARLKNAAHITASALIYRARKRAAEAGVPFDEENMTIASLERRLEENPVCSCCRNTLDMAPKRCTGGVPRSPSIDRLQPALGYVKGNVSVLCWRCNRLKSDATWQELERIAAWMRSRELG